MLAVFNEIFYRPFFNAVIFLYNILPGKDFGVAIIVLTVIIRVVLSPLTIRTAKSQKALSGLSTKVNSIKEKFKNDKAAQSAEIMKLYKENNINPMAGCLPLLIQLPILIGLYRAFIAGFKPESLSMLYSFVSNPGLIEKISLGFIDITAKSRPLAILSGVSQFIQLKTNLANTASNDPNGQAQAMSKQMLYFFPVMIIIIGWNLPAGLVLYWLTTTGFSILEQMYIKRKEQNSK